MAKPSTGHKSRANWASANSIQGMRNTTHSRARPAKTQVSKQASKQQASKRAKQSNAQKSKAQRGQASKAENSTAQQGLMNNMTPKKTKQTRITFAKQALAQHSPTQTQGQVLQAHQIAGTNKPTASSPRMWHIARDGFQQSFGVFLDVGIHEEQNFPCLQP